MASVFLSYDHEDAARAAPLAAALEAHGHSVWWDRHIHGGAEYNSAIETAVDSSDAVVVLWSANSIRSAWVRDEAAEGRDAGKLVPVLLEAVKPPMGFRQYQTINLAGWKGGKRIERLPELLHAIDTVARPVERGSTAAPAPARARPAPPRLRPFPIPPIERVSRRLLIGGGAAAAAAAALAGGGIWWSTRDRADPRFQGLMDKGEEAVRNQTADQDTVRLLEQAVAMQPGNPQAWGLLALVKSVLVHDADPKNAPRIVEQAEQAARRALSLDPKEPNALLSMFELEGSTLDWATKDDRLRQIIAIDANNVRAIAELVVLLQATGLNHESWIWNERALALEPLSADFLSKRALKLWIAGRSSQADKVIDQVRALYPTSWWPWWVRFLILALSGRARAAQAMLDGDPTMDGDRAEATLWRKSLPALDQRSSGTIRNAQVACVDAARTSIGLASEAVMILCALGEVDAAFDIADGFLLSRGSIVRQDRPGSSEAVNTAAWRVNTQWMFTPPAAAIRADPRFVPLCAAIGLVDYWQQRGVKPDYMRAGAGPDPLKTRPRPAK